MLRIIVGPPCAGKSTYCQENAAAGDVLVDYDRLAQSLGSPVPHAADGMVRQAAFAARDAVIDLLLNSASVDAWIIHTSPPPEQLDRYKQAGAQFVLINPGIEICLERAEERPPGTADAIRKWFESPPEIPDTGEEPTNSTPKRGRTMLIKSCPISIKAGPEDGLKEGEFLVYPSTFTKTPDSYGDIVKPGAFAETIAEWEASGNQMPGLYGHRLDDPDYFVAAAIKMTEDEHGWLVHGEFDMDSPKGPQTYRLVKGKRLNQLSFSYDILDEGQVELEDGTKVNELRKLKVYEFSFVPIGANQDTSVVAVKSNALALAEGAKAGRVISASNKGELRDARDAIDRVLSALETEDEGKANGNEPANTKEPPTPVANVKEPMRAPSAKTRLQIDLAFAEIESF